MVLELLLTYLPVAFFLLLPWVCIAAFRSMGKPAVLAALLSFFVISTISIGLLALDNWSTQQQVDRMDRDHDGFFSPDEQASWSAKERKVMDHYIGDGGRNVFGGIIVPVAGLIYSVACAVTFELFAWGGRFLKRRRSK
ncbi:hypothetical protein ACFOLG_08015 [Vogesella facilis]|uniref:Uncharacterized protein n=1 Tax=Vogesella facilis TaxID=1655232 RepID=A0ABV7RFQ3_9NEIS